MYLPPGPSTKATKAARSRCMGPDTITTLTLQVGWVRGHGACTALPPGTMIPGLLAEDACGAHDGRWSSFNARRREHKGGDRDEEESLQCRTSSRAATGT